MVLAGYRRVSHVGTRGGDSFRSPADQAAEIEAWAAQHGHGVVMLEAETDRKGSDAGRPIFRQAVEGVKSGAYDGVVVAYLSRAGRDLRLMLDLWDEVEKAGGAVYSVREKIDGSTPSGRLQRNLLASINQHELEERAEGFEHACRSAVERGIWQRRQVPRGYVKDPDTRGLIPASKSEEVEREFFRPYLAGEPVAAIARRVGMTPSGVRALLRNRVYLGDLKVRSYLKPGAHDPIVDAALFEAVQAKIADGVRPGRDQRPPSLLAGLVRCASCGHVLTRGSAKSLNGTYRCPKTHSGGLCPSPVTIDCERLDPYVAAIARAELRALEVTIADSDELQAAQRHLDIAKAELAAYVESVSAADVGVDIFATGARQRRKAVDDAETDLRAELARVPALPTSGGGDDVWEGLDVHERNTVLRGLLSGVIVRPVGRGKRVLVAERVRVIAFGATVEFLPRKRGSAAGIAPLPFPDLDADGVLGLAGLEDAA